MMLMRILTSIRMSQLWDNFIVLHNDAKSTHQSPLQSPSQSTHSNCIKKIRLKRRITEKIVWLWTISNRNRNMFCVHLQKRKKWNECMLSELWTSLSILQSQCIVYRLSLSVRILRTDITVMTKLIRRLIKIFQRNRTLNYYPMLKSLWSCSSSQRRNIILLSHSFWHN